jgi:ligand-binding SRPBCC domain-containing protein
MDYVIETRIRLGRPRPEVFAFFADPANLARLTSPSLGLTLLTPRAVVRAGAVLEFRLRWLGLPIRWRAYVRECDPPFRFLDVQVRGPWARWEHRHRFLAEGDTTWVEDRLVYRMPLGPLGRLLHALVVRRRMAAAWAFRTRRLGELLGPLLATSE